MDNLEERAVSIARTVLSIRLGAVDKALPELAKAIVALVEEATDGAPKPVLPPHDPNMESEHEGTGFGIFCTESDGLPSVVFFGHAAKARAEADLMRRQALDGDENEHLSQDHCVCRCLSSMLVWNSFDPDPRATKAGG